MSRRRSANPREREVKPLCVEETSAPRRAPAPSRTRSERPALARGQRGGGRIAAADDDDARTRGPALPARRVTRMTRPRAIRYQLSPLAWLESARSESSHRTITGAATADTMPSSTAGPACGEGSGCRHDSASQPLAATRWGRPAGRRTRWAAAAQFQQGRRATRMVAPERGGTVVGGDELGSPTATDRPGDFPTERPVADAPPDDENDDPSSSRWPRRRARRPGLKFRRLAASLARAGDGKGHRELRYVARAPTRGASEESLGAGPAVTSTAAAVPDWIRIRNRSDWRGSWASFHEKQVTGWYTGETR